MKKMPLGVVFAILLIMMGCTHSLRITNEETLVPPQTKPSNAVKLGFVKTEDKLINSVINEISLNMACKEAKKDYQNGLGIEVDYVSDLSASMKFRASGQNFLITIPGFIVFTHAWLGYKYCIDIDTQSKLLDTTGNTLSEATIITPYEIRYTSFARGAWSSLIGWFTPGFGLIDIIPGIIYSGDYDDRATPEFIEKAKPSYSTFVSAKLLEQVAEVQKSKVTGLKSLYKMEPVVIDNDTNEEDLNSETDRHYVIYVMKAEDGKLVLHESRLEEVSEETWQVLDKFTKKEMLPDSTDIKNILYSFGIADVSEIGNTNIYTMKNAEMVTLFKGRDATLQVANRLK